MPAAAVDPRNPDASLVVIFKNHAVKNEARSAAEGRPIFDDQEICEIRIPGSRNTVPVHPATERSHWVTDPHTGEQSQITYAERFSHQYQQFKARQTQTMRGTPLDFVPFLTEARRAELRALNVYTAEQLAGVDGQELKNLGTGGRDLKNAAMEFLAEAKTNAPNTQMLAELEALRARNTMLAEDNEALKLRNAGEGEFKDMSDDQVREYIKAHTGHAPQGTLSRKTLVRMATDARPSKTDERPNKVA